MEVEEMNVRQKRAIWYTERERRYKRVERAGLMEAFKASKYTSLAWFLKSVNRMDLYQKGDKR